MPKDVERFKRRTRTLHWVVVLSALALMVTGVLLWVPQWGGLAEDGWSRYFHRFAAVFFVVAPLLYFILAPRRALSFIKDVFSWSKDDLEWAKAAPEYYFGGDEHKMPPQPEMNSGQKLFCLVVLVSSIGIVVTGMIMWFGKGGISPVTFQAMIFLHDVFFILGGTMVMVHIYLGALHPRMTESLGSMITGKVSADYAKSHYGKWYDEVAGEEETAEESLSDEGDAQG